MTPDVRVSRQVSHAQEAGVGLGTTGTSLEPLPDLLTELVERAISRREERQGWVTIEGLAEKMGCTVSRIYDLRQKGLPGRKIATDGKPSKRLYFNLPEVWAWLEAESILV